MDARCGYLRFRSNTMLLRGLQLSKAALFFCRIRAHSEPRGTGGIQMKPCHEHIDAILRHLDNTLSGKKLKNLLVHLRSCAGCSAWLEEQRALSDILRQSRPLYSASADLRARLEQILSPLGGSKRESQHFRERFEGILRPHLPYMSQFVPRLKVLLPALLVMMIGVALVPNVVRQVHAASYIETAVSNHRNYLAGNLPLAIQSSSSEDVTAWLANKVPFPFRLPDSQLTQGGKPAYSLVGARLVVYKGSPTALVIYKGIITKDTISLLVASNHSAVVAGGEEVHSGELTFHYCNSSGFKVITWTTHGLSYALVSNVSGSAQASCLVCHQNMADHGDFRSAR